MAAGRKGGGVEVEGLRRLFPGCAAAHNNRHTKRRSSQAGTHPVSMGEEPPTTTHYHGALSSNNNRTTPELSWAEMRGGGQGEPSSRDGDGRGIKSVGKTRIVLKHLVDI